jgi:hypothetical protein
VGLRDNRVDPESGFTLGDATNPRAYLILDAQHLLLAARARVLALGVDPAELR